jgi:hypothetical protein
MDGAIDVLLDSNFLQFCFAMTFENGKSLTEAIRTVFSSNGGSEVVVRVACYVLSSPAFVSRSILFTLRMIFFCY